MIVKCSFLAPLYISAIGVFVLYAIRHALELEHHRILLDVIIAADQHMVVLAIVEGALDGRIFCREFHMKTPFAFLIIISVRDI